MSEVSERINSQFSTIMNAEMAKRGYTHSIMKSITEKAVTEQLTGKVSADTADKMNKLSIATFEAMETAITTIAAKPENQTGEAKQFLDQVRKDLEKSRPNYEILKRKYSADAGKLNFEILHAAASLQNSGVQANSEGTNPSTLFEGLPTQKVAAV